MTPFSTPITPEEVLNTPASFIAGSPSTDQNERDDDLILESYLNELYIETLPEVDNTYVNTPSHLVTTIPPNTVLSTSVTLSTCEPSDDEDNDDHYDIDEHDFRHNTTYYADEDAYDLPPTDEIDD